MRPPRNLPSLRSTLEPKPEPATVALTDIQLGLCAQHLDEAAFLWGQWEASLDSALLTLGELHDLYEPRLRAHLDALVLGGSGVREEFLTPALADNDPGLVTAAALVLLASESGDGGPFHQVLEALVGGEPDLRPCLQRALELSATPTRVPAVRKLLAQEDPALVATALEVLGFWGVQAGPELSTWLAHPTPEVAAAPLRVARSTPEPVSPSLVARALESPHPRVRDEALITGIALRVEPALARCRQLAVLPEGPSRTALLLLAMGGEASDLRLLLEQLDRPGARAEVLWALGFSGRKEAAEACLELLAEPALGGIASEAFSAITGLPLEGPFLLPEEEADDEDEEEPRPPEPPLPRASPEFVRRWWRDTANRLEPRGRYLLGRPLRGEWWVESFELVPMRRRHAMALELGLRSRGAHLVQTRAFSGLQRTQLQAADASARAWNLESSFRALSAPWAPATAHPAAPAARATPRPRQAPLSAEGLAVTGIGMVSALGDDAVGSCAASRAGVLRITELEDVQVFDPTSRLLEPARGHAAPWVTRGFTGLGRLVQLGATGLRDLWRATGGEEWERAALYVTTSSGIHARLHAERERESAYDAGSWQTRLQSLVPRMLQVAGIQKGPRLQKVFSGEAGFFQALQEATELLRQGRVDRCIVGGVDSLVEPEAARRLDALRLLKSPSNPVGFVPGEAAAFLLLESPGAARRRKAPIGALLDAPRLRTEPFHRKSGQPALGVALTGCIKDTLAATRERGEPVGLVIAGLNGDAWRAQDWGHALVRLRAEGLLEAGVPEWYPALPFGEAGAATGPLGVAMAARGFARGYAPPGAPLLWVGSDAGQRGALRIHAPVELQS